ncbi:NAD-dependent epimerase/dehydratase family protein [Hymenobacter negativus]|uniref:NAD(P)-dependent oxidoreductase n=1 Tax=Hymenobacter negativus TaxID=2795026 RepID=A0ABS3QE79_9BACT|nr:NAD(P)-dependent oxidoreductase [Hymenobacter negativus]MBO2009526.1 NAD(P)-dependent oxidoreductase [Hymenobacter negativus]
MRPCLVKPGRVVLTGATGFIGSYLAEELVSQGYEVAALRRGQSDPWRVAAIEDQLTWINLDAPDWEQQLLDWQAEYFMHSAWLGVGVGQRDDWQSQLSNLTFTMQLLQVLAQGPLKKVIILGSQAEYGAFDGRIDETRPAKPNAAYGAVKLATLALVQAYCQANNLEWYWLRVFAVFGPREDKHWFVSFVADSLLRHETPNLTGCEQRYDYLFVKDLARAIVQTVPAGPGLSGIYNIGANHATSLKKIVDALQELTGSATAINYGALPYRPGQVMHMESNSEKFVRAFGPIEQTPLPAALTASIDFVKQSA